MFGFGFAICLTAVLTAQKPAATPRQERLLNGLKVLVVNDPAAGNVSLRLRIHGGSAFDPQEKEGVMKMLSESFFPTPESRSFFAEELGGGLEVTCSYDYIQINASARSGEMLTLIETVAQAVANLDLSKETAASLRTSLLASVAAAEKDPAYVADSAVAKRLFGTFPYGRPQMGTPASLQRVDFADLRFAKERLLTADNATLAIRGSVDTQLAFRAARRYFGAWLKADKRIPSTFRQPDDPDPAILKIAVDATPAFEVRYAVRGVSRSAREFPVAEVLAQVLDARLRSLVGSNGTASVAHEEHVLPGAFVLRYRANGEGPLALNAERANAETVASFIGRPVTDAEFVAAKAEMLAALARRDPVDVWLDVDTYKITSPSDEMKAFQDLSLSDLNAFASRVASQKAAIAMVTPAVPPPSPTN